MEFLGVGPFELLLILIVALVVVGPERLPVLARQAGKFLVSVRNWVQKSPDAAMILRARQEIETELANIRESLAEVQNARDEVVNAARQVNTLVQEDVIGSTRAAIEEVRASTVPRATKPNGMPVDSSSMPASSAAFEPTANTVGNSAGADSTIDADATINAVDAEPSFVATDGTPLIEAQPAPETATIAPPRTSDAEVVGFATLQAQIAALAEELRGLQSQLQERGVIVPAVAHSNGNGSHVTELVQPELGNNSPAPVAPTIEENDDVDQPVYSRD